MVHKDNTSTKWTVSDYMSLFIARQYKYEAEEKNIIMRTHEPSVIKSTVESVTAIDINTYLYDDWPLCSN